MHKFPTHKYPIDDEIARAIAHEMLAAQLAEGEVFVIRCDYRGVQFVGQIAGQLMHLAESFPRQQRRIVHGLKQKIVHSSFKSLGFK